jgi:hypothetical protein
MKLILFRTLFLLILGLIALPAISQVTPPQPRHRLVIISPTDLTVPLRGNAEIRLRLIKNAQEQLTEPEIWMTATNGIVDNINVTRIPILGDSEVSPNGFELRVTIPTAKYPNGRHKLTFHSSLESGYGEILGYLNEYFTFDNGRVAREIRPKYDTLHMAMQPGHNEKYVPVNLIYTDTSEEMISGQVEVTSSNNSVARVVTDSPGLMEGVRIEARGVGYAKLTFRLGNLSSGMHVQVHADKKLPHLSRTGRILTDYTPGSSVIPKTLMMLGRYELSLRPNLLSEMRSARLDTLNEGGFINNVNVQLPTLQEWINYYDSLMNPVFNFATQNNLMIDIFFDDVARFQDQAEYTYRTQLGRDSVRHALTRLSQSGRVVSNHFLDENVRHFGVDPARPNNWGSLPLDFLVSIFDNMHAVPNHATFFLPDIYSPQAADNWTTNPSVNRQISCRSDYYDNISVTGYRDIHLDGSSLAQDLDGFDASDPERNGHYRPRAGARACPLVQLTNGTSTFYTKGGNGSYFNPATDYVQRFGASPRAIVSSFMIGLAKGATMFRGYQIDTDHWLNERATAPIGTRNLQTGIAPDRTPELRALWDAYKESNKLIADLETCFLMPEADAPHLGRYIRTGARKDPRGECNTIFAYNFNERDEDIRLELIEYMPEGTMTFTRYRLLGSNLTIEDGTLVSLIEDNITMRAGEAVIWKFPGRAGRGDGEGYGAIQDDNTDNKSKTNIRNKKK